MSHQSNPSTDTGAVAPCPLTPAPTPPTVPPVTIRCSVYFDGTGNNRANTAERLTGGGGTANYQRIQRWLPALASGSYGNDNTNVEKLERYATGASGVDHFISIYVQGIGTTAHDVDSVDGNAAGTGTTGVPARVNQAVSNMMSEIRSRVPNPQSPVTIYVDGFGFSRGSAAARYFVFQVMEHENMFNNIDGQTLQANLTSGSSPLNIVQVQIKFMGLFDTVAAYGVSHDNDVHQLRQTAITHAEKVVHLAAANEHRLNFPLIDTSSKGDAVQIYLPGVHSDVGGGYKNTDTEDNLILYKLSSTSDSEEILTQRDTILREINRLVNGGWYRGLELVWGLHDIQGTRTYIGKEYSFIPLHMMANYARQNSLTFSSASLTSENAIPADLTSLKGQIDSYASRNEGGGSNISDWNANDPVINAARHKYFHSSAYYDATIIDDDRLSSMRPQFWSATNGYGDSEDNKMNGQRKRRIYHG